MSARSPGSTEPGIAVRWKRLPVSFRAIITGLAIALSAANVWPLLLFNLGVPLAAIAEATFLIVYLWWAAGGGPPRNTRFSRATAFRRRRLSRSEWAWALVSALFFAATVHSAIVVQFRFVSFPAAAFREGYDFTFIPTLTLKWVTVIVSAASAGICEETGFRGYMQVPIEQRHGAPVAILVSSLFFTMVHLTKGWATAGMIPIVFGAGVVLGLLAWSFGSLIPAIIGHVVMDIGLFAYWWTGIAGEFSARPIADTGIDAPFVMASAAFAGSLAIVLLAATRIRRSVRQAL